MHTSEKSNGSLLRPSLVNITAHKRPKAWPSGQAQMGLTTGPNMRKKLCLQSISPVVQARTLGFCCWARSVEGKTGSLDEPRNALMGWRSDSFHGQQPIQEDYHRESTRGGAHVYRHTSVRRRTEFSTGSFLTFQISVDCKSSQHKMATFSLYPLPINDTLTRRRFQLKQEY